MFEMWCFNPSEANHTSGSFAHLLDSLSLTPKSLADFLGWQLCSLKSRIDWKPHRRML